MSREEFHEEQDVGPVYDFDLFRRLLGYVRPYRGRAAAAVALIVFASLLQLASPLLTALTLDIYVRPLDETGAAPRGVSGRVEAWLIAHDLDLEPLDGVALMGSIYVAVLLLSFLVLYAQSYVMQTMGQLILFDLRRQIFDRLQRLPVAYFDRHPIGRLVTRATTDVASLNELFSAGLVSIFGDLFILVGIVSMLFVLDARLALASFTILPLLFLVTRWFKSGARRSYRNVRKRVARINAFLQEHVSGMSIVQLMGREDPAFDEFEEANRGHRDAQVKAIFYYAVYFPMVELVNALGMALLVWYGGGLVIQQALSIGALVAFLQYVQRFYRPIANLSEKYNVVQSAMASSERIFELLDAELEIVPPENGHRPAEMRGAIAFEGVDFAYKEDELVLHDVSFEIHAGETIAVVGHTGAGKSTLANLILRFYDVRQGQVKVDGVDVREWDLDALRGGIAMVLQDVFLFRGDVGTNIRLGSGDEERMRWAAREAQALELIEELPQGFATELQERGAGLSVGQKQLISFARALAFDPRILILDEATASIDTETEQLIQEALDHLLEGRTSLVIAHRLSTIRRADRILVLHKGHLREMGTHEELLAEGGIYAKLYQLQFREPPFRAEDALAKAS